jgi:hypothetical protein
MNTAIKCHNIGKSYQTTAAYCSFIFVYKKKRPTQLPLEIVILW